MQCQPACLMSHDLHDKHAAVRERRGMDGIDDFHGDVHGRLEAERHLRAPEVVVDGLRQRHNGNAVLRKQVCRLVRAVAAKDDQAVKAGTAAGIEHFLELCRLILFCLLHGLERLARRSEDRSAAREDIGKILRLHGVIVALDEAAVAVADAIDGHGGPEFLIQRLCHASQGRIQALAVAAGCQHSDFHGFVPPVILQLVKKVPFGFFAKLLPELQNRILYYYFAILPLRRVMERERTP